MANNQPQQNKDKIQEKHERLEDAFGHINELHLQLRRLRLTLPQMLAPLSSQHSSPQALRAALNKTVEEASKELAAFKEAYSSEETKAIIKEAGQSRQANPRGIVTWHPSDNPDWIDIKKRRLPAEATASTATPAVVKGEQTT